MYCGRLRVRRIDEMLEICSRLVRSVDPWWLRRILGWKVEICVIWIKWGYGNMTERGKTFATSNLYSAIMFPDVFLIQILPPHVPTSRTSWILSVYAFYIVPHAHYDSSSSPYHSRNCRRENTAKLGLLLSEHHSVACKHFFRSFLIQY